MGAHSGKLRLADAVCYPIRPSPSNMAPAMRPPQFDHIFVHGYRHRRPSTGQTYEPLELHTAAHLRAKSRPTNTAETEFWS